MYFKYIMDRKKFLITSTLGTAGLYFSNLNLLFGKNKNSKKLMSNKSQKKSTIIIGSGYGGAVAALRLAEKGHKVCMLEMGLNWEKSGEKFSPMKKPGKSAAWLRKKTIAPFMNIFSLKPFTGALDRWDFDEIKIWMGRGVGGGSLVNGGMAVEPKKDYFKEVFPNLDTNLFYEKYFPLAKKELHVNVADEKFLDECEFYKFNKVGETEAKNAGFKTVRVPNVYDFEYMEKEWKKEVPRSALAGEVIYGNNHGKITLDKNYLKKAQDTGNLEILDLHKVESITKNEDGTYKLDVTVINTSGETVEKIEFITDKLIVSAGVMGSMELLLKSAAEDKIEVDENLGQMWGNNGNFMTGRNWVKAFSGGTGVYHATIPVGGVDNWEDKEHPFFTEIAPLPMGMNVATTLYLMINRVPKLGSVYYDTESKKLNLNWDKSHTKHMKKNAKYFIRKMNRKNGGTRSHLLFNNGFGHDVCYHPLGGAVLGKATDAYGKLNGHENLYVLDGSLVPGTIGVNPFLTITALAEFCIENIIERDYKNFS